MDFNTMIFPDKNEKPLDNLVGGYSHTSIFRRIAFIGDRMDTDILSGLESELDTCLVLTGVTSKDDLEKFPYKPKYVLNDVGGIIGL